MLASTLKHALMITSFVFIMMLVVEYVNVQSRGGWKRLFEGKRGRQYLLAAGLGALPGCLGAFTVVTLYSHGIVSFGALVATMVATSGDEAFVMLALIPRTAILITVILFVGALLLAYFVDSLTWKFDFQDKPVFHSLPMHEEEACRCFDRAQIMPQIKAISFHRFLLVITVLLFVFSLVTGLLGPVEWDWKRITFLAGALISLLIVSTVPEHFLQEHLWQHLIKKHLLRIFLWTFGTLLIVNYLDQWFTIEQFIAENYVIVLLIAVGVGLIPESGPHLVFLTLFVEGSLPLSILLANSASQDGHATLPLIAVSKKSFITLKLINLLFSLMLGLIGYGFGK